MGILTNPREGNAKIIKIILEWERSLCFLMYVAGITWLLLLALPSFNDNTYFSENALLPGLVTKQSNLQRSVKQFHQELLTEMERYPSSMPYTWIEAKFNQLYLDIYTHNFTLNYPFKKKQFTGKNIYGIIRAPRAASTESIVLSVPFRPVTSVHPNTTPSIALLLALAKFCRKQRYWAKDIIFLVTEHEQLGVQAWLDAYHGVVSGQDDVLMAGDLRGRAGSIQAAINLEFHSMKIGYIDVKIEGLNGQLPNLDLFNLAQHMIKKEDIRRSFQRRFDINHKNLFKKWWYHLNTLSMMIMTQATGVPTGNHGLFHRYGIEAITLEGFEKADRGNHGDFSQVGKVVESIIRSVNNLLERFHQSFFFYLLPSTDRYISIALYMPSLVLIIGSLFVKAFAMWLRLQESSSNKTIFTISQSNDKKTEESSNEMECNDFDVGNIAPKLLWYHIFGVASMVSPQLFTTIGYQFLQLSTQDCIYFGFLTVTLLTFIWFLCVEKSAKYENVSWVYVIVLVEFAALLMGVCMLNFSLALLTSIVYTPIMLFITSRKEAVNSRRRILLFFFWTLLHPFILSSIIVFIYTYVNFNEETLSKILSRSIEATKTSFVFSIIDSMIYGNWLYGVTVSILLPIWTLLANIIVTNIVFTDK